MKVKNADLPQKLKSDEKATITVMALNKEYFYNKYGNVFMSKYPNITIDVIELQGIYSTSKDPEKDIENLILEKQPDVLLIQDINDYEKKVKEGLLTSLDMFIENEFDLPNIYPGVVNFLKTKGDGKLYGLAPQFVSQALYYNKNLFDQYDVPYPKDQMSWEDIIQLSQRFPQADDNGSRIYGLSLYSSGENAGFTLMSTIGLTEGLSFFDYNTGTVTMSTEGWKKVFNLSANALKSKSVYEIDKKTNNGVVTSTVKENVFITGKAAMTMDSNFLIDEILRSENKNRSAAFEWGIVTVPVSQQNPNVGTGFSTSDIYSINSKSGNIRAAWELVKFINSDYIASTDSKLEDIGLSSRISYLKEKAGHSLEPFYRLLPDENALNNRSLEIPSSFYPAFTNLVEKQIRNSISTNISANESLSSIQKEAEMLLIKSKNEAESGK